MENIEFFKSIDTIDKLNNPDTFKKFCAIQDSFTKIQAKEILKGKAKEFKITGFVGLLTQYEKEEKHKNKEHIKQKALEKKLLTTNYKHNEVATLLLADVNNKFYLFEGDLYYYSKKGYYTNDYTELDTQIIAYNEESTIKFRNEIPADLKIRLYNQPNNIKHNIDTNYINFKNGLFSLNNFEFIPHSKDIFTLNQLNVNYYDIDSYNGDIYSEAKECVDNFLNDITCNNAERKQALLEMIGYSMTSKTDLQKSFMLYGSGANGKSTLTNLIQAVIGNNNCENLGLDKIIEDKFAISRLKNKILNVSEEMTTKYLNDSSIIKEIITADKFFVQAKYKDGQNIKNHSKFIFNINEFPKIADTSDGYYRRWHAIPFNARFDGTSKPLNTQLLFSERAKEYLAFISLQAYCNMVNERRCFSNKAESDKLIQAYKIANDNITSFLNDIESGLYYSVDKSNKTWTKKCTETYAIYKAYCSACGYCVKSKKIFYKTLQEAPYSNFIKKSISKGYDTYIVDIPKYTSYLQSYQIDFGTL